MSPHPDNPRRELIYKIPKISWAQRAGESVRVSPCERSDAEGYQR